MKYSVGQTGGKFIKLKKVMNPAKKKKKREKSRIREAKNLLTDADNRTDTRGCMIYLIGRGHTEKNL